MTSSIITKNSSTATAVPAVGDLQQGELAVNVTDKKVYTKDSSAAIVRVVGSLGNQEANAVAITGGTVTGITDLAVADGGTGASTAAGALNNLLPSQTSNANKYLQTDGTNATWDAISISTSDITGTLPVLNGGTGVTSSTGTGNVVLSNSPTLVTPALGTPASGTLTNATGLPISTGVSGLGTGVATFLSTPSSANLISAVTDETGTGSLVFATSPTLVTPALGTPSALVGTNITGTASGLTAGNVTTNANLTGAVTSVGNATSLGSFTSSQLAGALTDETGSGANVFATSPTLVTPILGTPTSATLTNATGLPLTTGVTGTLPTANGGTNLTSFTSGGVVYASSTSALATGSALTYNGTVLTASASASTTGNFKTTSNTAQVFNITASNDANTTIGFGVFGSASGANGMVGSGQPLFGTSASDLNIYNNNASGVIKFGVGASVSEGMRLTSTGLGIGTTSPAQKLDVVGTVQAAGTHGAGSFNAYIIKNLASSQASGKISWQGSTNVESWAVAQNQTVGATSLEFNYLGVNQAVFNSSGNLGIGTGSPAYKLDVNGNAQVGNATAATNRYLYINGVVNKAGAISFQESGTTKWLIGNGAASENGNFEIYDSTNANSLVFTRTGNLGLGVTPSAWGGSNRSVMQFPGSNAIQGSGSLGLAFFNNAYNNGTNDIYSANGAAYKHVIGTAFQWFTATAGTAGNAITFTQAMTLDASGNLMLGITNGTAKFDLAAGSGASVAALRIRSLTGNSEGFKIVTDSTTDNIYLNNYYNAAMLFGTNNTERARINSSGYFKASNTGGYDSATGTFHELLSNTASSPVVSIIHFAASNPNGIKLNFTAASPNNTTEYFFRCADSTVARCIIYSNGNIQNTNNSYGAISDVKLKENIVDSSPKLADLMQVKVRNFNMIGETSKQIGVIAQELETVFPAMVDESPDRDAEGNDLGTKTKSVKYSVFVPMLIKAIQEQQVIIESLKARLDAANL